MYKFARLVQWLTLPVRSWVSFNLKLLVLVSSTATAVIQTMYTDLKFSDIHKWNQMFEKTTLSLQMARMFTQNK